MADSNGEPAYGKEAAFFSGLLAGALFCALWSGLFAILDIWGDLGATLVTVASAAVAAATVAYRLGSTPARAGALAIISLVGSLVLTVLLALTMGPLEPLYLTVLDERPLFYGVSVAFGALMATIFGKRTG
jgi:hypothetical protein